jgi:hypothetical protein
MVMYESVNDDEEDNDNDDNDDDDNDYDEEDDNNDDDDDVLMMMEIKMKITRSKVFNVYAACFFFAYNNFLKLLLLQPNYLLPRKRPKKRPPQPVQRDLLPKPPANQLVLVPASCPVLASLPSAINRNVMVTSMQQRDVSVAQPVTTSLKQPLVSSSMQEVDAGLSGQFKQQNLDLFFIQ